MKDTRIAGEKEVQKAHLRAMCQSFEEKWSVESMKKVGVEFHCKFAAGQRANAYDYRGINLG